MRMTCLEFRRSVGAQPNLDTEAVRAHLGACEACARYRQELQQMDQLIQRALKIDLGIQSAGSAPQRRAARRVRYWAAAASFLAAAGLGSLLWIVSPSASLAEHVVQHTRKEAHALIVTAHRVDASTLTDVFARSGVRLAPGALNVSYAMSCWFRGRYVPHLVVQTQHGPVTVLVLPHETAGEAAFSEDGYQGMLIEAPKGVLAVLARGAPVNEAAAQALAALEYE